MAGRVHAIPLAQSRQARRQGRPTSACLGPQGDCPRPIRRGDWPSTVGTYPRAATPQRYSTRLAVTCGLAIQALAENTEAEQRV